VIDWAYAFPTSLAAIKQLSINLTPWLSPDISYEDKQEIGEQLGASEQFDGMTFIHIGRGSNGGSIVDAGAADHPQLYAYCPNLDWDEVDTAEVWQVWYNHMLWSPMRRVWQEARLAKMVVPTYQQVTNSGGPAERTLLTKEILELQRGGCNVYDALWKQMCSVAGRVDIHPALEYFEDMELVVVLKSTQGRGKSSDVLEAVTQRWSKVLDFEYLIGKGIDMAMSNRACLTRRVDTPFKTEASMKRRKI
jgi:hypothetical protein